jgi:hypothetical protein
VIAGSFVVRGSAAGFGVAVVGAPVGGGGACAEARKLSAVRKHNAKAY